MNNNKFKHYDLLIISIKNNIENKYHDHKS